MRSRNRGPRAAGRRQAGPRAVPRGAGAAAAWPRCEDAPGWRGREAAVTWRTFLPYAGHGPAVRPVSANLGQEVRSVQRMFGERAEPFTRTVGPSVGRTSR